MEQLKENQRKKRREHSLLQLVMLQAVGGNIADCWKCDHSSSFLLDFWNQHDFKF